MKKLIALLLCCGIGFLMSCQQQTTADDYRIAALAEINVECAGDIHSIGTVSKIT